MEKLTEKAMSTKENRIPALAENAVKQARSRTLASGRSVIEVKDWLKPCPMVLSTLSDHLPHLPRLLQGNSSFGKPSE